MTNGQKKKILLIDDDYDIHDLIRHTLSREFELSYAEYLNEGESLIKKNPFDLLILDETLPDGRGSDLCHKLKNELDFNDLQIISSSNLQYSIHIAGLTIDVHRNNRFCSGCDSFLN